MYEGSPFLRLYSSWMVYVTISIVGLSRGTIRLVLSMTVLQSDRPCIILLLFVLVLRCDMVVKEVLKKSEKLLSETAAGTQ